MSAFDLTTIYAVHLRLRDQVRRPRLFNDRMPAGRARVRLERFRHWCGPILWQILCDCELKRRPPKRGIWNWPTMKGQQHEKQVD